jgi:hypothetical protein
MSALELIGLLASAIAIAEFAFKIAKYLLKKVRLNRRHQPPRGATHFFFSLALYVLRFRKTAACLVERLSKKILPPHRTFGPVIYLDGFAGPDLKAWRKCSRQYRYTAS